MRFDKPSLTFEQQADLLVDRGMIGDRRLIVERLKSVGYYRLSGYWYPFRKFDPDGNRKRLDDFETGTTFEKVWSYYIFDRRLRLLTMDAIERIEVCIRSLLAQYHGLRHGTFGYYEDSNALPSIRPDQRTKFLIDIDVEYARSKETFAEHFKKIYGAEHRCLPIWMACEVMSFGGILTFHRGCHQDVRRQVAAHFGIHDSVFDSWLLSLNIIRNVCAHHGRLWNRELGIKPKIPVKLREWHAPVAIGNDRMFGILTILCFCIRRIAPQSNWKNRCIKLLADHPHILLKPMGFPDNWNACSIWT